MGKAQQRRLLGYMLGRRRHKKSRREAGDMRRTMKMSRKKNTLKRSQMKGLETSREEDCQRLLHLEGFTISKWKKLKV